MGGLTVTSGVGRIVRQIGLTVATVGAISTQQAFSATISLEIGASSHVDGWWKAWDYQYVEPGISISNRWERILQGTPWFPNYPGSPLASRSVFHNVSPILAWHDIISPPFVFSSSAIAEVSFYAAGKADPHDYATDSFEVTLERVNGSVPVAYLLHHSFVYDPWGQPGRGSELKTGGTYWDEIRQESFTTDSDTFDVAPFVEPQELYQLRFRTSDFDDFHSLYFVEFGDVRITNGVRVLPGDANGNGLVDGGDYTVWADNYLMTGRDWTHGDFNHDWKIDGGDYTLWADNYSPFMPLVSAVPEPSTRLLAGLAAVAIAFYVMQRHYLNKRVPAEEP